MKGERQTRSTSASFQTRAEGDEMYINGYFSVFNSNYEIFEGATESIDPMAFDGTFEDDIRCLIDHESRLVLGRTKVGTLLLRVDEIGLWGEVKINPRDQDAVNLYERVKRGDVDQCSFGFDILEEEYIEENGRVHWTIKRVKLYEVSVVTFPAYKDTSVTARQRELKNIKARKLEQDKNRIRWKLKGDKKQWH